jgi:hypothetical protein
MTAILALIGPFMPYVIAALAAIVGGGSYVWNAKRKARAEGVALQQAKEAEARAQDIENIRIASGARPSGSVLDDPNNRDNTKG